MRKIIAFILLSVALTPSAFAEAVNGRVNYDRQADTLTLAVEQHSLKELLGKIAMQSQLEVLFDDKAEQPVTVSFTDRPLEEGLKNLLHGSNYAFRYARDEAGEMMLVGVRVLPQGSSDPSLAQPLLHVAGEAFMNAKHNSRMPNQERALFNKRWQARLAEMSPEIRKKVTEKAQQRLADIKARNEEREARREERKAEREEKRAALVERHGPMAKPLDEMTLEERTLQEQRMRNVQQMLSSDS